MMFVCLYKYNKKISPGESFPGRETVEFFVFFEFLDALGRPCFHSVTSETDARAPNRVQSSRFQEPIKHVLNLISNQSELSYCTQRVSETEVPKPFSKKNKI